MLLLLLLLHGFRQFLELADGQQPRVRLRDLHGVCSRTQGVSVCSVSLKLCKAQGDCHDAQQRVARATVNENEGERGGDNRNEKSARKGAC